LTCASGTKFRRDPPDQRQVAGAARHDLPFDGQGIQVDVSDFLFVNRMSERRQQYQSENEQQFHGLLLLT
jgi:hypothetical protein